VTDANDMIAHLEREPESDIVAAMLVDELMQTRGMLRTEADRHVTKLRMDARDNLDMLNASFLVRPGSPVRDAIHLEVKRVCWPNDPAPPFTLVLRPGSDLPRAHTEHHSTGSCWWYEWVVLVPARWVLRHFSGKVPTHRHRLRGHTKRSQERRSRAAVASPPPGRAPITPQEDQTRE
jgi:hypothetical protein